MEIVTKAVIESIKFNEGEKDFMKTLAKYIDDTCRVNAHCEFCPFCNIKTTARVDCSRIADGLINLAKM